MPIVDYGGYSRIAMQTKHHLCGRVSQLFVGLNDPQRRGVTTYEKNSMTWRFICYFLFSGKKKLKNKVFAG